MLRFEASFRVRTSVSVITVSLKDWYRAIFSVGFLQVTDSFPHFIVLEDDVGRGILGIQ